MPNLAKIWLEMRRAALVIMRLRWIATRPLTVVPTDMAQNPAPAPHLFDRALLRARQDRARRLGPATFLLDRITEDMDERLAAVTRDFSDAAEIWTPGALLRNPKADRFKSIRRIEPDDTEALPLPPESIDLAL